MKIFFSEATPDYNTYTFPYAVYCRQETEEEMSGIYARGFLPYSDQDVLNGREGTYYYLSRSIRVNTSRFSLTSENRRIRKKMAALNPGFQIVDKPECENDKAFWSFCENYAHQRIGDAMPPERLRYIFSRDILQKIFKFVSGDRILGYVWAPANDEMIHYWFSFFDTQYMTLGIGKWMMEQVISYAADQRIPYVYLGTCYGSKAMYKIRDFKGIEYFDGNEWRNDLSFLKSKCKETDTYPDDFKRFKERF